MWLKSGKAAGGKIRTIARAKKTLNEVITDDEVENTGRAEGTDVFRPSSAVAGKTFSWFGIGR